MTRLTQKTRLLGGGALSAVLALLAAAPAQAVCTVTPSGSPVAGTVTCATTTTTNTTYAAGTTASDRNYNGDTSTTAFTGTISSGARVDGFGLAFSNTVSGTNALNIVNNGTVEIDAGNIATAGGGSALEVTATGATPVNYSGEGNVINFGLTSGHALDFFMQGTGNLVANVGITGGATTTISSNAPGSAAIQVNRTLGTAGNVTINTTSDTLLRARFAGINIDAAGTGTMTVNNAAAIDGGAVPNTLQFGIRVIDNGTGAVSITNSGSVGRATDRTSAIGLYGVLGNNLSTAPLSISGSGPVFSSGTGISAINFGSGTTTINYTGAVDTTGSTGVFVSASGGGATSVTTGAVTAATDAIVVQSGTAPQTITANGVTTGTAGTGITSSASGARTITVGAAGNVTGGTQAILLLGAGAATINNSGIIGAAPSGLAINLAAATNSSEVFNNAGATLNGRLTLGSAATGDLLSNSGTFNTQGTTDFGVGADALINTNTGVINILGPTAFANLELFAQAGRINLNANTLTLSGTPFFNSGTIDTSGSASILGITSFNNPGTLDLAAGTFTVPLVVSSNSGTVIADEGVTQITGQTSFNNSGTLNLQDGATNDVLTINSDYVGVAPAQLRIDASGALADQLIVNGAASGSTVVNVNLVTNGSINSTGVLVVDNLTSAANAFTLGTVNNSPLLAYSLVPRNGDYFLVAAPTIAVFQPLSLAAAASDMWYQSADEVISQIRLPYNNDGFALWGQIYASRDKFNGNNDTVTLNGVDYDVNNNAKNHRYGAQAGVDFGFGGGRVGVTGGYARNKVSSAADLKIKGWNAGVYGQFGGATGFHGEALVKYDRYKVDVRDGAFAGDNSKLRELGVDGALGYRFGMGSAILDLNAGLAHVRSKLGGIDNFGFSYDYSKITSTRGRAGVRAVFGSTGWRPYVDATVLHEFDGKARVNLFDGTNNYDLDYSGKGTWARFEAGVGGPSSGAGPILAAWADVGDKKGVGVRLGFRFGAGREEMAPPPPLMAPMAPPPPPPATQTCADGSVILASDTCPPPPAPPPPPAEPERG